MKLGAKAFYHHLLVFFCHRIVTVLRRIERIKALDKHLSMEHVYVPIYMLHDFPGISRSQKACSTLQASTYLSDNNAG
jgi:hypothetical protein